MNTERPEQSHEKTNNLSEVYKLLNASSPLEMSNLYDAEDQRLMKLGQWDYDNPELITNKVKTLLEQIDPMELSEDERGWRQEVLWFWYHHAISCAIQKGDQNAAQMYSEHALELQSENHPNQITKLLYFLVRDDLANAEEWANNISDEPEKSTAHGLITDYKEHGFFKK